ncbi:BC85_0335 family putative methyltransferase [Mycoplasma nasistruthionis]|uniref:Class I SAM-dependent methyltransferase n=1 Tax=Mycoplasma nasistruthionis TaxID=353852 RepID=A0A5B7XWD3_9MOLU|nr:hypothetical protein [Mycoplasma nasistruthionis]QCZ36805.1 hypothetical protein FG904_02190 [Mycoplasma nasistruthionis]
MGENTKLALWISAIVVLILGISTYVVLALISRRIRKKYLEKSQAETMIQIQSMRNDLGTLPFDLKDHFKSKALDLDIEGLINTIYQNSYSKVLVLSTKDQFYISAIANKVKATVYYDALEIDLPKINEAKENFPADFPNQIHLLEQEKLDFIAIEGTNQDLNDLFDKYYSQLNTNGMIAISYANNPKPEIKKLISHLKLIGITYEVSYLSSKYLFIVKK